MRKTQRSRYPILYEINARVWLSELSELHGHPVALGGVPEAELERIAARGFEAVWLMGVWTTGPEGRAVARIEPSLQPGYLRALPDFRPWDCAGSPYSVAAYEVPEDMGGPVGLAALRDKLRRHGLRLVLDFVSNHMGRDCPWIDEDPDLFVRGSSEDAIRHPTAFFVSRDGHVIAHGRDPYFPPWTDTAQINYSRPRTRERMLRTILSLADRCDGLRCDMAMLILPEILEGTWGERLGPATGRWSFWGDAIHAVKDRRPDFTFLAEAYWGLERQLQVEGFDFTYDKALYDRLREGDAGGARAHLTCEIPFQARCARFVENHDEDRAVVAFGREGTRSAAAATFFTPGLRLFHQGQIEGRRAKLPVQIRRAPKEEPDAESVRFHESLLGFLREPIFQEEFEELAPRRAEAGDAAADRVLAHLWTRGQHPVGDRGREGGGREGGGRECTGRESAACAALIVVNSGAAPARARVLLPSRVVESSRRYELEDRLTGERTEREGRELLDPGLTVALAPHGVQLLAMRER